MEQAIKIAIENGYAKTDYWFPVQVSWGIIQKGDDGDQNDLPIAEITQDPPFWQALGKGLGWGITDDCWGCGYNEGATKDTPEWKVHALRYFETLLTGGDVEAFWKDLLVK